MALSGPKAKRDFTPGNSPLCTNVGIAQKCTLCYDRLVADETPACAKACPTTSIKFGEHDDMVAAAGNGSPRCTRKE